MSTGQTADLGIARHGVQIGGQTDFTMQPLDPPFADPGGSPWASPVAGPRKLSHFRKAGGGDPMWSTCVYGLTGFTPSFSEYDTADPISDASQEEVNSYEVTNGVIRTHNRQPIAEGTLTRNARVSAHYDSSPAARFFQGFANVRWSGLFTGMGLAPRALVRPRPLAQSNNPGAWGSKELHPATQYKPFPPMGSIVPAYGEMKAL